MYVRLAFAVAAHLEPEILIVDEVLAVGDAEFQKKCLGKMNEVAREGRTVLFVSHNMGAIESLCMRGILLKGGSLQKDASPQEAIQMYLSGSNRHQTHCLADRNDRTGSGRIRFTGVKFLKDGREVTAAKTRESLEIELSFKAQESFREDSLRFGISFVTSTGIEFMSLDSAATGFASAQIPQQGILRCRIPSLPVVQGIYSCWIYAGISGVVADRVEDAFEIEVTGGHYPKMGFFSVNHEWLVDSDFSQHDSKEPGDRTP